MGEQVFILKTTCPLWDSSLMGSSACLNHPQGRHIHVALDIFIFSSFFLALSLFNHDINQGNAFPLLFAFLYHSKNSQTVLENASKSCPKIELHSDYSCPHLSGESGSDGHASSSIVPAFPCSLHPSPPRHRQPEGSEGGQHLTHHSQIFFLIAQANLPTPQASLRTGESHTPMTLIKGRDSRGILQTYGHFCLHNKM